MEPSVSRGLFDFNSFILHRAAGAVVVVSIAMQQRAAPAFPLVAIWEGADQNSGHYKVSHQGSSAAGYFTPGVNSLGTRHWIGAMYEIRQDLSMQETRYVFLPRMGASEVSVSREHYLTA